MSVISAGTTTTTAFKVTGDTTGTLQLQTGAVPTTAINISATQVVTFPATTTLDFTGTLRLSGGTANGVLYLNGSKDVTGGSTLTFDGTTFTSGAHTLSTGVLTVPAGTVSAPAITTSGDTNTGIFFPAADTIAFTEGGVEAMRLDSAGNVGIGTTSPSRKLTINENSGDAISVRSADTNFSSIGIGVSTGSAITYIQSTNSGSGTIQPLTFWTGASERARITSAGNVGIGTTSPGNFSGVSFGDSILDVNGAIQVRGDATNGVAIFQLGGDTFRKAIIYSSVGTDTPYLAFGVATSGSSSFVSEYARITSAGAMGIGTSNPQARLEVNTASGANAYALAAWPFLKWDNSNELSYGGYTASQWQVLKFFTAGTERARITSDGCLAVGTTSGAGTSRLRAVNGNNTNGDFNIVGQLGPNAINTSSYQFIGGNYAGADNVYIYGNGNIVNTNNSYGTLSDVKLKQDIIDAASQWDDVKAFKFRKFRFKEEVSRNPNAPHQLGLIAQELEQTSPGLVDTTPDRQKEGETMKTIKTSVLLMKATKALQEAMLRIENLEAEVNALKAN